MTHEFEFQEDIQIVETYVMEPEDIYQPVLTRYMEFFRGLEMTVQTYDTLCNTFQRYLTEEAGLDNPMDLAEAWITHHMLQILTSTLSVKRIIGNFGIKGQLSKLIGAPEGSTSSDIIQNNKPDLPMEDSDILIGLIAAMEDRSSHHD
jgi:hypothetical protein